MEFHYRLFAGGVLCLFRISEASLCRAGANLAGAGITVFLWVLGCSLCTASAGFDWLELCFWAVAAEKQARQDVAWDGSFREFDIARLL